MPFLRPAALQRLHERVDNLNQRSQRVEADIQTLKHMLLAVLLASSGGVGIDLIGGLIPPNPEPLPYVRHLSIWEGSGSGMRVAAFHTAFGAVSHPL